MHVCVSERERERWKEKERERREIDGLEKTVSNMDGEPWSS